MAGGGHGHADHGGDKRVALLISVLALCLALAHTGANSAQTDVITQNVEASNLWAFFQARTIRQTTVRVAAEEAELQRASLTDPAALSALEAQQKAWRDTANRWESEPSTGEGRKELADRAREAEHRRERSAAKYHLYEYSAALFEVAIVVASASIVTSVPALAIFGAVIGIAGMALGGVGFFAPEVLHFGGH